MKTYLCLPLLAVLISCASAPESREDCAKTNWQREGSRAISNGEPLAKAWQAISKKCVAQGFSADKTAFERGWGAGFPAYCQPRNALLLGRKNHDYQGICTPPQDAEFLRAYDLGRVLSKADQEHDAANDRYQRNRRLAEDLKLSESERLRHSVEAATAASQRDAAAARVSSIEAVAAQQGWGLGR